MSFNGKTVKGGTIILTPVGDSDDQKPASGEVLPDGSFTLGTTEPGDGVIVGQYQVRFTPPEQKLTEAQRTNPKYKAPPPPYMGLVPETKEVEIKSGENSLEIKLVKGS